MVECVEVVIQDRRWRQLDLKGLANSAGTATLKHLEITPTPNAISLLGCDDPRIAALNQSFRNKAGATNVLSWPSAERSPGATTGADLKINDAPQEFGDIAISYDTCAREAREMGKDMPAHVTHLIVHGILHLLGYEHTGAQDAATMERLETEILVSLGIEDPYRG
ncbi:MAG: rRNA maturation RNase YbeY [Paracoccaceae bacterium]